MGPDRTYTQPPAAPIRTTGPACDQRCQSPSTTGTDFLFIDSPCLACVFHVINANSLELAAYVDLVDVIKVCVVELSALSIGCYSSTTLWCARTMLANSERVSCARLVHRVRVLFCCFPVSVGDHDAAGLVASVRRVVRTIGSTGAAGRAVC